ncbi:MAG TPA: ATP-binding protein [Rhodothermales bacterium]|nr:ATP-binding protein [Rhodothermales bacterium]
MIHSTGATHRRSFGTTHLRREIVVTVLFALLLLDSVPVLAQSTAATALTKVAGIRALSSREAARGYPVDLSVTVTYYDPEWGLLFVQDETNGIFVDVHGEAPQDLHPGDRIELKGVTDPGDYAPSVAKPQIRRIGPGPLPPLPTGLLDPINSGLADSRWIELEGVVRCVHHLDTGHIQFDIVSRKQRISVYMRAGTTPIVPPEKLIDSHVRVRGASASVFNNRRQLIDVNMFTPGGDFVKVEIPGPVDPYQLPVLPVDQILTFRDGQPQDHRVHIRGQLLYYDPGHELYIRDSTGGIQVRTQEILEIQPGDTVDVVGFPESRTYAPILQDADVRRRGSGPPPAAIPLQPEQELAGSYDGQLVQVEGRLEELILSGATLRLGMKAGTRSFYAVLSDSSAARVYDEMQRGSILRLRGIYEVDKVEYTPDATLPKTFRLILRTENDIAVTQSAPWWTFENLLKVLAAAVVLMMVMLVWVVTLRRRVRWQTRVIKSKLEAEENLKREAQLANEAKSRFLSAVTHELRTPLTSIIGYADILYDELCDRLGVEEQEFLSTIRKSGERLLGLVNDLLDLRTAEAGHLNVELRFIPVKNTVTEVMKQLYPLAEAKSIELSLVEAQEECWVYADEMRLRQVLINLISNAIKFTREGGVTVGIGEGALPGAFGDSLPAVRFTVQDTGVGISPDFLPHLFEQFTQDKQSEGDTASGTGLGLAISRELVLRMGGSITVESKPNAGSCFTVLLPSGEAHLLPDNRSSSLAGAA